jgi:aspartate aminotransferase
MVTVKVAALRREGIEVIDFGAGEPDFDTPEHIKDAAIAALKQGKTKYTPVGGTAEVKEAIIAKLQRDNDLEYALPEVTTGCGGKHILFNAFHALVGPGDEVLIPAPYWVSYSDIVVLAGGTPKLLPTTEETGFKITAAQLQDAIGPHSKVLLLNSPSNPTGAAYTEDELSRIAEVIESSELFTISDDVYEKFLYDAPRCAHLLALKPGLRDRLLVANSVSKTYAMTGWRLGYAAGPPEVIKAMETIQSQSTSNPSSISQAAAVAALTGTQEPVGVMAAEFAKRRNYIVDRLRAIPGITCTLPEGAFYVFPNVSGYFGAKGQDTRIESATDFALYLLEEARVALVAGEGFGAPNNVRISYATSMANLEQGMDQMEAALKRLGG